MIQNNTPAANCLTINLLSFSISQKIILETDELIIKVKILPDGNKQKQDIKAKKMENCNFIFRLNTTNQSQKLLFYFRKKTFFSGNHTIGTSVIDIAELIRSASDSNQMSVKTLDIYYPVKRQLREQQPHGFDRSNIREKVIGQLKFTVSVSEPIDMDQNIKQNKKNN